jgi:tetratricopeptide (TPR) repeat protein
MSEPSSRSPRLPLFLGLAFLLILCAGGVLAWLLARQGIRSPLRVLLITAPAPGRETGLEPAQERALGALVQDSLELGGRFAVSSVTEVPADLAPFRSQPHVLLVRLEPRRLGDDLELSFQYAWGQQIGTEGPVPWTLARGQAGKPSEAFDAFLRAFPQTVRTLPPDLMPKRPAVFWDLVRASGWRLQNQRLEEAMALADQTTRQEPSCGSTWILLGNLRYRRMLNSTTAFRQEQADTEANLQRGLALVPGHPRGIFLASLLKADSGNQRDALDLLLRARRKQPFNPTLLTGIAYAARNAGLLPLARRAMDLRDGLAFPQLQPQAVDITCLYTGEIPRFEASLQEQPGHLRSTSGVIPFYRGYLALVRGDRAQAKKEFHAVAALENGYPNILRLAEIYDLILDGQKDEAWQKLREYDQERIGMREPDGEFTIRLAEAYALMGDRASAMDMAGRAFARGFGCTAWYDRSPLLEPLRGLPKWKALIQHLRERQKLMEDQFPPGLLEDN